MSMECNRYPGFPRPTVDCSKDARLTVQSARDEVDINKIVARLEKGHSVPSFGGEPFYGDVSEIGDLQDAMIKVREANELFMQYPADLREKFDNDPVKMVAFLEDPGNLDKAVELGLAQKREAADVESSPASPEPGPGK